MERKTYTGTILRAIRLYYNYTQSDFAAILGVSQASLSKLEAHQVGLSADQWIGLCMKFSLDPHCLTTGIIQAIPRNINGSGYRLPKIYSANHMATVRYIYPLIKLMKKILGESYYEKFLKDNKIDSSYFTILSNPINANIIQLFFLDLYKHRNLNNDIFNELLALLSHEENYPALIKNLDRNLSIEEKYQAIFTLFRKHFNQDIDFMLNYADGPIASSLSNTEEASDFGSKFKMDYLAAFANSFDYTDTPQWNLKVERIDSGWGLYRVS